MGWLLYLKAWICIFLIASNHCFGNDVIQFNNQTFVKTGEIFVNVFEKDLIESQLFEIDYQSFIIPIASTIENITDDNIKMQLLTYNAGGHERQRRVVPVFAIAGFFIVSVLIMSTAYVLYETKKELHTVEKNLNEVSLELAKLNRIVNVDKYISNFKFNLNSYTATTESLIIDFLEHLSTGETILLESLPTTILNQFKNFNVKSQSNRFYFLKLQQATKNGIVIEIKAVHGQKGDNMQCHKYINMGYFEANIFHRYLMDNKYICYHNATCFEVEANQCTTNLDHFNCTKDSLHMCSCDPTDFYNCQIESEIASSNFVFVQQFKEFVVASHLLQKKFLIQ
uniref:Uncharacterized protein n=1 Tax=Panagrolaimus sp. PS1159 TaxID=55785 RepID=A0AC35EYE6_9BILA